MYRRLLEVIALIAAGLCLVSWLGLGGDRNLDSVLVLLKAGVGEDVIKAHIASERMTFELSARDMVRLKKTGASDELISHMMGNSPPEAVLELYDDLTVGSPVVFRHLSVFPVLRRTPDTGPQCMTLDEAQRTRVIVIREHPAESVPTVVIRNIGRRPIYIIAGEIIIGGKQDRMISHDVLIPAGKEIEVSVRCVEHGRWHGRSGSFESGGALGSTRVRTALQFKAQQDVWKEVEKACEKYEARSESGTYGAILASKDVESESEPFLDAMRRGLREKNMVGMIMALNGEIICADIFAGPALFAEVKDKLLKAYVLDAIGEEQRSTRVPGSEEIRAFFEKMNRARTGELKTYEANDNLRYESDEMMGSESRDKDGRMYHLNLYRRQE